MSALTTTSRKGFTLIELMVAISIIAIISAVGITTFSQSQKLARDAKRKQDLRSIGIALELYYQRYGHYPCSGGAYGHWQFANFVSNNLWIVNRSDAVADTSCGGPAANQQPFDSSFISYMPNDPSRNTSSFGTGGYQYTSSYNCAPVGKFFYLFTPLENDQDPDTNIKKVYKRCDGTPFLLSEGYPNNLFIVGSY